VCTAVTATFRSDGNRADGVPTLAERIDAPSSTRSPAPHAEAPPAGATGGFGETTCAECHMGSEVNAYDGRVSLEGLPDAYVAGQEYALTVDLVAAETSIAGFQLAARFAEGASRGRSAGALTPVDGRTEVTDSAGIHYLHQSDAGSATADPNGARWSFDWQAPVSGGPVAIHVAANSGNGDESPLGDLVYTHQVTLPLASSGERSQARTPRF